MDFNIQKEKISLCETGILGNSEHAVDCQITLPEYLPDIVKILRCYCVPGVKSHQLNGDRITADCACLVRTVYVCEQGTLHCFEQNIQFAKQIEVRSTINPNEVFVGAKTDYVNYRVSGQRNFEVHGAITVFAKSSSKKCIEPVSNADGDGIVLKSEACEICDLVSVVEKMFNLTETCDAGNLSEPIGAVVSSCGWATIDELKIVSDKLFLKGQLLVHTAFTGAESHQVHTLENVININQIIEAPDITEKCQIDAFLSVCDLEIKPRFDLSGNKNLVDITASLNISVKGYETRQIACVKDAYSTKYETDINKSVVYTSSLHDKISDSHLCRGVADLNATGVNKILSFMCTDVTSGFSVTESACAVNGQITADIIYEDAKSEICYAQREIPFEYSKPLRAEDSILTCTPHCSVTAFSYVLNGDNKLDVRVEIDINAFIFCEKEKLITTELSVNKDRLKTIRTASLTVYFADAGEAVWNIAEKYNTTVDAVMRENHLTDTHIKEKCKLLIVKED